MVAEKRKEKEKGILQCFKNFELFEFLFIVTFFCLVGFNRMRAVLSVCLLHAVQCAVQEPVQ